MTIPSAYFEGAAVFTSGETTVTGIGTAWSTQVRKYAIIWRASDGAAAVIASDPETEGGEPEDLQIELLFGWPHSSTADPEVGEAYVIQNFRDGGAMLDDFADFTQRVKGAGMGFVTSGPPNPEDGRNNDFRFDPDANLLYFKVAGSWQEFSVRLTFDAFSSIDGPRENFDDQPAGFTWFDEDNEVWHVKATGVSGDWRGPFQFRGPRGGDRYDVVFDDPSKPLSGEIIGRMVFTTEVEFPAGLNASQAKSLVAANAQAVFSLRKNNVEFGTATFGAASTTATFAAASATTFAAGDVLSVVAPDPQDSNLSGVTMTITGFRDES